MLVCASTAYATDGWHHPLYLGNGGVWRSRVPVQIHNETDRDAAGAPVAVQIGDAGGQVPLAGSPAEAIRVCDAEGTEMLFRITSVGGDVTSGPIPAGARLVIPAQCPAGETATYYVYADNPHAWQVAEFLQASVGVRNGGVEHGEGDTPTGWRHDAGDEQHQAMWVRENPHSGQRCLKTIVAGGAEPTWIATRQRGIHVIGGQRYRLTAWVRAKDVEGYAGWYVHVGNEDDPMIIGPMARAGDGTFDWTQVSLEFDAPEEANQASLGTVLRGTGAAWFDDVALEAIGGEVRLTATAGQAERLELREIGAEAPWADAGERPYRMPVTVTNLSPEERSNLLVHVDTTPVLGRLAGRVNPDSMMIATGPQRSPSYLGDLRSHDGALLFQADVPARSISTFHLYFSDDPQATFEPTESYADLLHGEANMARNPSFEEGGELPADWPGGAEGERPEGAELEVVEGGLFGERAARIQVPHRSRTAWTGWRQDVPVRPGRTYLFAAWVRTEDIAGTVRIHAHYRTADGELCETQKYTSAGPDLTGTEDWTLLSGLFEMPADAATFQLHLTMNATGTVWHDGVVMAEATSGHVGEMQVHPSRRVSAPSFWPVNPIVKVFRDDPAPQSIQPARITAARNDVEPLQLAVRAPEDLEGLHIEVDQPTNAQGEQLPQAETAVVGYVPIDHATSYYSSQRPTWQRKYPRVPGRCDGWAGWWPDPLRPTDTFDLDARTTQPIWLSLRIPEDARAGDYRGAVRIVGQAGTVAETPFMVHVWDFTLPPVSHVQAIYDARAHHSQWFSPGEGRPEQLRKLWRLMADLRLCPDRVHPAPSFSYEDGEVSADFTAFDEAAEYYFEDLGFQHSYTPGLFYCFGWGHPPKSLWGVEPYDGEYPYEGVDRSRLRPEYRRVYQQALRLFWEHVQERGWADRFVLYISDEPWFTRREYIVDQMRALCEMIHEVSPEIPIYSSTWSYEPRWRESLDVWGVGHYGRVPPKELATIREAGGRIWWTTDGQMCTDTPFCAIERLLPHYCFQYGAEAYEFWGIDWLTYDPWEFGWHSYIRQSGEPGEHHWVRYPNGDGYLAYPGEAIGLDGVVSSIRLEMAREGVEDYEYLQMLRELVARGREAAVDVSVGEAALAEAEALVDMPSAGGRYSTEILPRPGAVLQVKETVARAIETLRDRLGEY